MQQGCWPGRMQHAYAWRSVWMVVLTKLSARLHGLWRLSLTLGNWRHSKRNTQHIEWLTLACCVPAAQDGWLGVETSQ
jgi:hypothetical protein